MKKTMTGGSKELTECWEENDEQKTLIAGITEKYELEKIEHNACDTAIAEVTQELDKEKLKYADQSKLLDQNKGSHVK
jgi:hypothetical protein